MSDMKLKEDVLVSVDKRVEEACLMLQYEGAMRLCNPFCEECKLEGGYPCLECEPNKKHIKELEERNIARLGLRPAGEEDELRDLIKKYEAYVSLCNHAIDRSKPEDKQLYRSDRSRCCEILNDLKILKINMAKK